MRLRRAIRDARETEVYLRIPCFFWFKKADAAFASAKEALPSEKTPNLLAQKPDKFLKSFELDKGFVVKDNAVQIFRRYFCEVQAVIDWIIRKTMVMFNARKPLLLSRCDYSSILDQTGGAVMVISGYTENIHLDLPE